MGLFSFNQQRYDSKFLVSAISNAPCPSWLAQNASLIITAQKGWTCVVDEIDTLGSFMEMKGSIQWWLNSTNVGLEIHHKLVGGTNLQELTAVGEWCKKDADHINVLGMWAVVLALLVLQDHLVEGSLVFIFDCLMVVAHLDKQRSSGGRLISVDIWLLDGNSTLREIRGIVEGSLVLTFDYLMVIAHLEKYCCGWCQGHCIKFPRRGTSLLTDLIIKTRLFRQSDPFFKYLANLSAAGRPIVDQFATQKQIFSGALWKSMLFSPLF